MYQFANLFYSSPRYTSLRCSIYMYLNIFREPLKVKHHPACIKIMCFALSCIWTCPIVKIFNLEKNDHTKLVVFDIAHTQFCSGSSVAEVLAY